MFKFKSGCLCNLMREHIKEHLLSSASPLKWHALRAQGRFNALSSLSLSSLSLFLSLPLFLSVLLSLFSFFPSFFLLFTLSDFLLSFFYASLPLSLSCYSPLIMLTSLAPSPMASVTAFLRFLTSSTT